MDPGIEKTHYGNGELKYGAAKSYLVNPGR
jgi:hypothetical protein